MWGWLFKIDWKIDPGVIRGLPAGLEITRDDANGVISLSGVPRISGHYVASIPIFSNYSYPIDMTVE